MTTAPSSGFLLIIFCALGCVARNEGSGTQAIENTRDAEFRAYTSAAVVRDPESGRFIAEGDIAFGSENEVRRYFDAHRAQANALTVRLNQGAPDTWTERRLTYCISGDLGFKAPRIKEQLQRAAASWSEQVNISFVDLSDPNFHNCGSSTNVTFEVRQYTGAFNYYAVAFWPSEPRTSRKLMVGDLTNSLSDQQLDFVLRHELGHIMGFRHENIWTSCYPEPSQDAQRVTEQDDNSVMNDTRCKPLAPQSTLDFVGAVRLYGPSQPPPTWVPITVSGRKLVLPL